MSDQALRQAMNTIKRYDPYEDAVSMSESPSGDYVKFADHETALEKAKTALNGIADDAGEQPALYSEAMLRELLVKIEAAARAAIAP